MKRLLISLLFLSSLPITVSAQTDDSGFEILEHELDNGLRVVLVPRHETPTVAVAVYYDVGSRSEVPGRSGFAHLFEHMMFQGSENVGKGEHFQYVNANGGSMNGTTSEDRTNYFEILPSDRLALGLWLESDRMRSLDISTENFENQREVVKEERRLRVDNQPYARGYIDFVDAFYDSFEYGHSVIGSMEDLDAAELADVQAFFDMYYAPNNAVLVIAGDFEPAEALELVNAYFGDIPRGETPPAVSIEEPGRTEPQELVTYDSMATQPAILIGWPIPAEPHEDNLPLQVLAQILAGGESSRFYSRLVRDDELALDVTARVRGMRGPDMFYVDATVRGENMDAAAAALLQEIARVSNGGVSQEEVNGAIGQLVRDEVFNRENNLRLAMEVAREALYFGDPQRLNNAISELEAVTLDDVNRVAVQYLAPTARTEMRILVGEDPEAQSEPAADPAQAEATESEPAFDRTSPPLPGTPRPFELPSARELTLANGLSVVILDRGEDSPTLSARLSIRAGSDRSDSPALPELVSETLRDGTVRWSAAELADYANEHGVELNVSSGANWVTIQTDSLSSSTQPALELLFELAARATFPADRLEARRGEYIDHLTLSAAQPSFHRDRLARRVLFGDHPYGTIYPTVEQLNAVTQADVQSYYQTYYGPAQARLVLVGDVPDDIE
ncbi:MAG: insulinase family protein, partial [Myxococcales bacterium]|nr:insulinase family protein [Myxococcales bacterium]